MSTLPQIFMRHPDLSNLPPIALPHGISLHNHIEGEEGNWEELIERSFRTYYSFDKMLLNWWGYKPEYVLYLSKDGKDIATASAMENAEFPGEGWLHMVGVDPDSRGMGAGRLITLAVLHMMSARGFKTAVLSTDDERLSAIKIYYYLGFRPIFTHESHEKRWADIYEKLNLK